MEISLRKNKKDITFSAVEEELLNILGGDEATWFLFLGVFCGLRATVDVSLCHVLPPQK